MYLKKWISLSLSLPYLSSRFLLHQFARMMSTSFEKNKTKLEWTFFQKFDQKILCVYEKTCSSTTSKKWCLQNDIHVFYCIIGQLLCRKFFWEIFFQNFAFWSLIFIPKEGEKLKKLAVIWNTLHSPPLKFPPNVKQTFWFWHSRENNFFSNDSNEDETFPKGQLVIFFPSFSKVPTTHYFWSSR